MNDSGHEAMPTEAGPTGVLVLGMHRSGTSALAGVLNILGAVTPGELMPPTEANERGYFEKWSVVRFNDDVLAQLGSAWDDPLPLATSWIDGGAGRASLQALEALIEAEFAGVPFFSLKDPRISRLLPLWLRAMEATGRRVAAAIPLRHPLEVVGSVVKRDGLPRAQVLLSWLDHMIEAERGSRALPRAFLRYADLLADWRGEMERLRERLGLSWSTDLFRVEGEIDAFLGADLRHHRSDEAALRRDDPLEGACAAAWDALGRLRDDPDSAEGMAALDAVRERIAGSVAVLGSVVVSLRADVSALRDVRDLLAHRESDVEALTAEVAARGEEIDRQGEAIVRLTAEYEARGAEIERRGAEIAGLTAEYEARGEEIERGGAEIASLTAEYEKRGEEIERGGAEIASLTAEYEKRGAEIERGGAEIASLTAEYEKRLEREAAESKAFVSELLDAISQARAEVSQARADRGVREAQLAETHEHIGRLDQALAGLRGTEAALRAELAAVWEAREQAERDLRKIRGSTSWRVTRPLRGVMKGTPRLATASRRALRGSWWAVTGQLPRRMEERRARLTAAEAKRLEAIMPPVIMPPEPPPAPPIDPLARGAALKEATRALLKQRLVALLESGGRLRLPSRARDGAAPDVSIVIILYNQAELTFGCLASIVECLGNSSLSVEVILLDNGSTDETGALLDRIDNARIVRSGENLHFLRGVNRAADEATGRHLLLLNNDAQLTAGSLEIAVGTLDADAGIGAVGGRIVLPDGTLQEAGSIVWSDGSALGYARGRPADAPEAMFRRDVDYCSGAFLLTPRAVFERLGRFDEVFAPAYYEETDYCVRLWETRLRVVFDPRILTLHYEFGSSTQSGDAIALQRRNSNIFRERHLPWLAGQLPMSANAPAVARAARTAGKRILFIDDRLPRPELGSGYPRARDMILELERQGVAVTLYPTAGHDENWLSVRANLPMEVEYVRDGVGPHLGQFLDQRRGAFDALLVSRPHNMVWLRRALKADPTLKGAEMIIYDAEAMFSRRELLRDAVLGVTGNKTDAALRMRDELRLADGADAVLSVSEAESRLFREHGLRNVEIIGHTLETDLTTTPFEDRQDVLFLGAMHEDASPNADSLRWFASDILPVLRTRLGVDLRVKVVGLNKAPSISELDGKAFDLVGQVNDLRPYFETARVIIVPTRFAAGIPHKAHQAAAFGVPMVVTELIAEQLGWRSGQDLLSSSDPEGFADACARLYADRDLWDLLRENAANRLVEDCSPEAFRSAVSRVLDSVPHVVGGSVGAHARILAKTPT